MSILNSTTYKTVESTPISNYFGVSCLHTHPYGLNFNLTRMVNVRIKLCNSHYSGFDANLFVFLRSFYVTLSTRGVFHLVFVPESQVTCVRILLEISAHV